MKKNIYVLLLLSFLSLVTLSAQTTENVSVGASYANQTFYRLSDGQTQSTTLNSWHIAFSVFGTQDAGIFVNEGAALSGTPCKLFSTGLTDFSQTIDTNSTPLTNELNNLELSWNYGAFNELRAAGNPLDYGWGVYNPSAFKVEGSAVYVLRLPSGALKKIKIDSLSSSGVYHFRYADLNGSNLEQKTLAKADFSGQTLAYFSLTTGNALSGVELSGGWDLLFTRYGEIIPDGQGGSTTYNVTGVLSARGVSVAQADGVNTSTVNYQNYLDSLTIEPLYTIGSDWKNFDFTSGWSVVSDRAYFVRTANNTLWKLVFIDFQGSGTGISTLQKTNLGTISSIVSPQDALAQFDAFPNPTRGELNVVFDFMEAPAYLRLQLQDLQGRLIFSDNLPNIDGFAAYILPDLGLESGIYILSLQTEKGVLSKKIQYR